MMLKSQLNTHAPQEKKTKIKAIFIWTTAVSVTFIIVAIFQLATRFDRSTTLNAFIMRHSIYNSCNLIGTFFIILSFGGLRFWKNPKKSKSSDQSTRKISKNSKNSGKSESARDLKHSSAEIGKKLKISKFHKISERLTGKRMDRHQMSEDQTCHRRMRLS